MTTITVNDGEIIIQGDKYKVEKITGSNEDKIEQLRIMLENPPKWGPYWSKPNSMFGAYTCACAMYYNPFYKLPIKVEGEMDKPPKMVNKPGRFY